MVFIYTTCREETQARTLGGELVKRNFASCVDIWRIGSIYPSNGGIVEEKEVAVLIRTMESKVQEIEDFIIKYHEGVTHPFIGVYDTRRINRDYKEWMSGIVK